MKTALLDECSAKGKLRQLEQAIRDLPLKEGVGEVKIKNAARSLLMAAWEVGSVRWMARHRLRKSGLKDKQGRSREVAGDYVGIVAALTYEELTDTRISRRIVSDAGRAPSCVAQQAIWRLARFSGESFFDFGHHAKADGVNQRLQVDLKADLKAMQAKLSKKF